MDGEVEVGAFRLHLLQEGQLPGEGAGQLDRDRRRGLLQLLCQDEARESEVPQLAPGRERQRGIHLARLEAGLADKGLHDLFAKGVLFHSKFFTRPKPIVELAPQRHSESTTRSPTSVVE